MFSVHILFLSLFEYHIFSSALFVSFQRHKLTQQTQYLSEFEVSSKDYEVSVYSVPVEWAGLGISGNFDNKILGKDEYFVLADNRIEGIDSRVYGVVDASRIKGVAVWKFFPFNKMKLL